MMYVVTYMEWLPNGKFCFRRRKTPHREEAVRTEEEEVINQECRRKILEHHYRKGSLNAAP